MNSLLIHCYNDRMKSIQGRLYNYTVIFEPAEEGGFVVSVPALPGCVTQGETFEEALAMAKDAIQLYIEVLRSEGGDIPIEAGDSLVSRVAVTA